MREIGIKGRIRHKLTEPFGQLSVGAIFRLRVERIGAVCRVPRSSSILGGFNLGKTVSLIKSDNCPTNRKGVGWVPPRAGRPPPAFTAHATRAATGDHVVPAPPSTDRPSRRCAAAPIQAALGAKQPVPQGRTPAPGLRPAPMAGLRWCSAGRRPASRTPGAACRGGSRFVRTSPEAIRRSRVDRDTESSRQASVFVNNLMVVLLVCRWIVVVPVHVITCHF